MFSEYMVYLNDRPILLVCDNTVFVKKLPEVSALLPEDAPSGYPYEGAKEYYILDIENSELNDRLIPLLIEITPLPKPKKRFQLYIGGCMAAKDRGYAPRSFCFQR